MCTKWHQVVWYYWLFNEEINLFDFREPELIYFDIKDWIFKSICFFSFFKLQPFTMKDSYCRVHNRKRKQCVTVHLYLFTNYLIVNTTWQRDMTELGMLFLKEKKVKVVFVHCLKWQLQQRLFLSHLSIEADVKWWPKGSSKIVIATCPHLDRRAACRSRCHCANRSFQRSQSNCILPHSWNATGSWF